MKKHKISNQNQFDFFIQECKRVYKQGKSYVGMLKEKRKNKSYSQIKLYFAWIKCIMISQGYMESEYKYYKDDYHKEIKKMILGYRTTNILGKDVEIVPSIKDFDTKQMYDYMEKVRMEMEVNWDIRLPDPDDKFIDEFIKQYS